MARLRYTGTFAHSLTAGGRVLAEVVHGTEFDCPDSWVAALIRRGTPVEVVEPEPQPEEPEAIPLEPLPEVEAVVGTLMRAELGPEVVDAMPARGRRRR